MLRYLRFLNSAGVAYGSGAGLSCAPARVQARTIRGRNESFRMGGMIIIVIMRYRIPPIVFVSMCAVLVSEVYAQPARPDAKQFAAPPDVAAPPGDAAKTATGLASKLVKPGPGAAKPTSKDMVTVHYTGWTTDGKMFDSSHTRNAPSTFPLERVIAGWRECVGLMTVGETRRCWVPQDLAYKGMAGRPA